MAECHAIDVRIEQGRIQTTWECTAMPGAPCRLTCPQGCESWDAGDHIHPLVDAGECLVKLWLENETFDETYNGPIAPLVAGPVAVNWHGEGYDWHYAEPGVTAGVPVGQLRAAIRLLYPEEMTPHAKRMLEQICDAHAVRGTP